MSLRKEPYMIRRTIDLNPIELKYYPFEVNYYRFMNNLDKFNGSCRVVDELSTKIFVLSEKKMSLLKYSI